MIPKEKVEAIVSKHSSIEKELASGNIDSKNYASKSKEYSELGNIVKVASHYLKIDDEKQDLENLIKDPKSDEEMLKLAKKEINELTAKKAEYENKLKIFHYQKIRMITKTQSK